MASQHYRSPFGDTTFTKVFVGGLAWETHTDVMRAYFEQFGDILEAVIIHDKNTGKSKGYGFVTFRDPESANRACVEPNPVIDGRRANCNVASLGRPRPSPPRGRNQVGDLYRGGSPSYHPPPPAPPLPPPPPVMYPPYGYTAYTPPDYGYHQTMYSPHVQQAHYYNQVYGAASSSAAATGTPYYYGYSIQAATPPRVTFHVPSAAQRFQAHSYLYYPTQVEGTSSSYAPTPHPHPHPLLQPTRPPFPSYTDSVAPVQTSTETEAGPGATSTTSSVDPATPASSNV